MKLQDIKNRFEIIGNSPLLNIALETAIKVAPTEMSVLINGESGVGKENFSKIIHSLSTRKLGPFIALNCGAIPEGTIDSELFGHEKGAFTGAHETRKGYFETVNGGTIFLDEIGEMPLETQSRLLRVLESGEFIKVGASKVQKTSVRVIAATNRDLLELTNRGRFREDLYYRLSTVPIKVPPLRERGIDAALLFRKFSQDFAEQYQTQQVQLDDAAREALLSYRWPGNIRQLKNVVEQLSVLEENRMITAERLVNALPKESPTLPALVNGGDGMSERDIFYKVLFDMKKDITDLKQVVYGMLKGEVPQMQSREVFADFTPSPPMPVLQQAYQPQPGQHLIVHPPVQEAEVVTEVNKEDPDSLMRHERDLIRRVLNKHLGRRNRAARELGISERTLYRKIKMYDLEESR